MVQYKYDWFWGKSAVLHYDKKTDRTISKIFIVRIMYIAISHFVFLFKRRKRDLSSRPIFIYYYFSKTFITRYFIL